MKRKNATLLFPVFLLAGKMLTAQDGNLGVGTPAPLEKLHVNGNVLANDEVSTYGSYFQAQNNQNVRMTLQATGSTSTYGARGIVGTTSAHPLQLIYNANPVIFMDNGTFAPNGTNNTYLGADLNRWNGVYSGGVGFDAKNASGLYVGMQSESQNGVQCVAGAAATASAYGATAYFGSKTAHQVTFLYNASPVMYLNSDGFYPSGNNNKSIGYVGTAALSQVVAYAYPTPSDIRFKKNIQDLNYGINDIMKMRAVTYDLRDGKNEKRSIGFIAQEMEEVIPEIVSTNHDSIGYKAIDYVKVVPVLIKGMQEQQQIIEAQRNELKALKAVAGVQGNKITALEAKAVDQNTVNELMAKIEALQQAVDAKNTLALQQ